MNPQSSKTSCQAIDLELRRQHLAWLQEHSAQMLAELAAAAGLGRCPAMADDPLEVLEPLDAFIARTDFSQASDDARIWMVNRLGLFLARLLMQRHGGALVVNADRASRFFSRIVVGVRQAGAHAQASIDPFAIAREIVLSCDRNKSLRAALEEVESELQQAAGDSP